MKYCKEIGIPYLSFYVFSTENWKRSEQEIQGILKLMTEYLDDVQSHLDEGIRYVAIGDISAFPDYISTRMQKLMDDTKDCDELTILFSSNYGGLHEITHAAREIAELAARGELSPEDITEDTVAQHLYTAEFPDVDLVIRPSGELRLSNFLIWQCAYAEYYFTNVLWPDFSTEDLDKALIDFAGRGRRFGGA